MKIYNTLTKKIEEFVPHNKDIITMYTCGPTVYSYAHIGNIRTYIFEDILEKSLNYLGYDVKRVMNITDVGHMTSDADTGEDKMVKGAKEQGKTPQEIADFYTEAFFEDFLSLNLKRPGIVEKATDHIKDYINVIEVLLEKGYAYQAGGNVYFDISKIENYYELSGKNEEDLIIGARSDVEEDILKRNPFDFGLWFTKSKFEDQDQKWESPWGVGYPGWHIECSTLAGLYLGEYLDIHCGAVDLVFPHHTNEIAQSEAYFGHKWCNYWIYGEHLNDKDGKMSKSAGAKLTINYLKEQGYDPMVYKYFCLGSHYRNQLVFSYDSLDVAKSAYEKLKNKTLNLTKDGNIDYDKVNFYQTKFKEAINNDLNTSSMLTLLYEVLNDKSFNNSTKLEIITSYEEVLGLNLFKEAEHKNIDGNFILEKIEERNKAKENKNYVLADQIREELLEQGIQLLDTKEGTTYKII